MFLTMILPKAHATATAPAVALLPKKSPRALFVILALALAIRVWGTWFGHPYVLHPDEQFIAQKALDMLKSPAYDLNPHFFEYPSLCIYLTAFLYLMTGMALHACGSIGSLSQFYDYAVQNIFYFHLLGRLLAATLGAATVYFTYLSARRCWNATVALVAAWFLTFAYVHFTDSHFLATDVPSAFFAVWAYYLCVRAYQTRKPGGLHWAAFVAGLAASAKYPVGLILLTVLAAHVLRQRAAGASWRRAIFSRAIPILSLCAAAGFLVGTPYALLDFKSFASGLLSQIFHSKSGHLGVPESGFWGYFTAVTPSGGLGLMLVSAVFAGMLYSLWKHRTRDLLLLCFPFFFYLLMGNATLKVDRYLIPVLPFWCIYAGIFITRASEMITRFRWPTAWAATALALLFSAPSIYYAGQWCWIAMQEDTRVQAADWIKAHIPRETNVAMRAGSWMLPPVPPGQLSISQMELITEESSRKKLSMKLALLQNPLSAWILRHGFDYQLDFAALDSMRAVLQNLPDFSTWRARPLAYYRERGVHFVISSSLLKRRFFDAATCAKYPEMAKSWQEFYSELEEQGRLVQEFVPPAAHQHPWGMGFLERPTISIYDIRDPSVVQAGGTQ